MFSIGWGEIIILVGVALLFIGPQQLPDLARKVASLMKGLTRARDEWLELFRKDESLRDIRESIDEVRRSTSMPVDEFRAALQVKLKELEKEKQKSLSTETQNTKHPDVLDEPTELFDDEISQTEILSKNPKDRSDS